MAMQLPFGGHEVMLGMLAHWAHDQNAATPEPEAEFDEDLCWNRSMSEPAKVHSTFGDVLLPPGLCTAPSPARPEIGLCRQVSEPVKISTTSFKSDAPRRRQHSKQAKKVSWSDNEEEDMTTSPSTMSGDESVHTLELPSLPASPAFGPASDPLLPRWVELSDEHDLRGEIAASHKRSQLGGVAGSSLGVIVSSFPTGYSKELFLEELDDGGFIGRRDFDCFEFIADNGYCFMRFVDVATMHSFIAAFDGREMRHGCGREFTVTRC